MIFTKKTDKPIILGKKEMPKYKKLYYGSQLMEIDYTYKPLTDAQKKDRREKGACLRCGEIGYFAKECKKGKSNKNNVCDL